MCWPISFACNGDTSACDNNYDELCDSGLCDCSQQDGTCRNNISGEKWDGVTWCPVNGTNTCVETSDPCASGSQCDAGWKEKCTNKEGNCYNTDSGWKKPGVYCSTKENKTKCHLGITICDGNKECDDGFDEKSCANKDETICYHPDSCLLYTSPSPRDS